MSVSPIASNQNVMLADDETGHRPVVDGELRDTPHDGLPSASIPDGESNAPLPVAGEDTEVGLAQKGTDEDAVVRRETEI